MSRRPYHPRGELVEGHVVSKHPLYATHAQMLGRCLKPDNSSYKNYGARGIAVCERWMDFRNFVADMGPKPTPEHTLERIDNDGNYTPENCTWATRTEQVLNRRQFANNTSGVTGVVETSAGWHARYDYEGQRYSIGWFKTKQEAADAREAFVMLFEFDRESALRSIEDRVRNNSSSGHRGITSADGGFIVRCTVDGERHYVGYFKELNDAVRAREEFLASRTGRIAGRVQGSRHEGEHK